MQFVTSAQAAHGFADLAYFTDPWVRVTIFYIDARPWFDAFRRVVAIIRNIAGPILNEIIFGRKSGAGDALARGQQKIFALVCGHVQIDGLEKAPVDESAAAIAQHRIAGML